MRLSKIYRTLTRIENTFIYRYVYKAAKVLVNLIYPKTIRVTSKGVDELSHYIISLTSFPARIDTVWITITTLLKQTIKPQKVVLWLSSDEFTKKEDLPIKLLNLEQYGLEIQFCDNLYPHKKYFYSMLEYKKANIITVDDDIFYPETLVEDLISCQNMFPDCVVCNWAHKMTFSKDNKLNPYDLWESGTNEYGPSMKLLAVGFGGVLYPPNVMDNEVFAKETFMQLCPKTDDLWLKCMSALNDTRVVRVHKTPMRFFSILSTQKNALTLENVNDGKNDIAMERILQRYPDFLVHIAKHES